MEMEGGERQHIVDSFWSASRKKTQSSRQVSWHSKPVQNGNPLCESMKSGMATTWIWQVMIVQICIYPSRFILESEWDIAVGEKRKIERFFLESRQDWESVLAACERFLKLCVWSIAVSLTRIYINTGVIQGSSRVALCLELQSRKGEKVSTLSWGSLLERVFL